MLKEINRILRQLKEEKPLVLNITNDVTMDIVANGLLSLGASPVMSKAKQEMNDLIGIANAVVINLGTLDDAFLSLCYHACEVANKLNKPIIFDPVGAGASHYRTSACQHILNAYQISIIRGNASEVIALSGNQCLSKGVDSTDESTNALENAKWLATKYHTCVLMSGETDVVVDSHQSVQFKRGSSLMPSITGTGCLLSAVVAAFHAIEKNPYQAAHSAALFYSLCGEQAEKIAKHPSSFRVAFLDALNCRPDADDKRAVILTIAGTDPSGGAGIQADIKVISVIGCYAASVITALVAQNTQGVISTHYVSAEFIKEQLHAVFSDLSIQAVKIGMLPNQEIMHAISSVLKIYQPPFIVVDPVMIAKSGHALLNPDAIDTLKTLIFPLANLITPNLFEAEQIIGGNISSPSGMENAAKEMGNEFRTNILLKGGHLSGEQSSDVLFQIEDASFTWFHADRINTKNTHGTGCSLSSAIASHLGKGENMINAISKSKDYLTQAISAGSQLNIGKGNGPVDHFFNNSSNRFATSDFVRPEVIISI